MSFEIMVIYALPEQVIQQEFVVDEKTLISTVLAQFCQIYPHLELSISTLQFGIFGIKKQLNDTMQPGDRVEIYRELIQDPKTRRLKKVKKK